MLQTDILTHSRSFINAFTNSLLEAINNQQYLYDTFQIKFKVASGIYNNGGKNWVQNEAVKEMIKWHNFKSFIIQKLTMGKKKSSSVAKDTEKKGGLKSESTQAIKQKEKARHFAKIYREYSRRKYNKYKLQYPRLRQSQIVNKIIKEWEALSDEDKLKLQKIFIETGGDEFLKDDSKSKSKSKSKSDSSSKQKPIKQQLKKQQQEEGEGAEGKPVKKKKKPSPKVRVFVEKATDANRNFMDDSDFKESSKGKHTPKQESNQSIQIIVKGGKKIRKPKIIKEKSLKKAKSTEYLQFFKYYYNRLAQEHPRWTSPQVTAIIKLLWRKRNLNTKGSKKRMMRNLTTKPLSGRVLYRREKQANGLNLQQIKVLWKHLPHESKKYWERRGRGNIPLIRKQPTQSMSQLKKVMKSGSQGKSSQQSNALQWMDKVIKTERFS